MKKYPEKTKKITKLISRKSIIKMFNILNKFIIFFIISGYFLAIPNKSFTQSNYEVIIQKDLFDEKRGINKIPSLENLSSASKEQLNKYQLVGIIKIDNKIEGAYIKPAPQGKPDSSLLLKSGDKLEGWKVEKINDKSILLKSGENTYYLSLFLPEKGNRKGSQHLGFTSSPHQLATQINQPQKPHEEDENPDERPDRPDRENRQTPPVSSRPDGKPH